MEKPSKAEKIVSGIIIAIATVVCSYVYLTNTSDFKAGWKSDKKEVAPDPPVAECQNVHICSHCYSSICHGCGGIFGWFCGFVEVLWVVALIVSMCTLFSLNRKM
jgi:hypothetical protein